MGHLLSIRKKLVEDKFKNEIEFQEALYEMTLNAHDGHFLFWPDALTKVFLFRRPFSLVSYAPNATSFAQIKVLSKCLLSLCPGFQCLVSLNRILGETRN
jgi:hypothetical protein